MTFGKKTIRDFDLKGKTVLHHCDFNIKLIKGENGELIPISDVRLKAFFPSIFYLLERNCKIVFISYLERPGGKVVKRLSLQPVAKRLSQLFQKEVFFVADCIGPKVKKAISKMKHGQMLMLENTRFYPGEEADEDGFAKELASNGQVMVQDAFGHCHRVHASVTGVARHIPAVAGFYLEEEIKTFDKLMTNPQKPLVLIIGGTKAGDKIKAIENLLKVADKLLVGGSVANNFLKASGRNVGSSLLGEASVVKDINEKTDLTEMCNILLDKYGGKIVLPEDVVVGNRLRKPTKAKVMALPNKDQKLKNWAILDLGPKTISRYLKIIASAKTIFWDGPLGNCEDKRFEKATFAVAGAMAANENTTILAGGDTAAVAEKLDLLFKFTHVSIAGGAALEYLSAKQLPGIAALMDK